jgi:hypothetical protein
MSEYVRRVAIRGARGGRRLWVADVSDEDGAPIMSWTHLRSGAARYYDTETAHRVAELARRSGRLFEGETVCVYRKGLPR